ncbi:protein translocase subunit SecF [Chloroflexota bacterium]
MFNFVSKRKWFFLISALVIIPGIISLIVSGLNLGLDFRSGTTMTLVFRNSVDQDSLRTAFADLNYPEAVIQHSAKDAFLIEGLELTLDEKDQLLDELQSHFQTTVIKAEFVSDTAETLAVIFGETVSKDELSEKLQELEFLDVSVSEATTLDSFLVRIGEQDVQSSNEEAASITEQERIEEALYNEFGALDYLDYDYISASFASERVFYTGIALIVAAVGILLYITWTFRKLVHSPRYGLAAIIALVHDALVVLGIFSLFRIEVNSIFIIAILTVIGYSVNNTIVVFDRIRENRPRHMNKDFESVVNISLTETLGRSINTSLTTLFALLAIYLFGGATISNFALALIVGIIAGTYSSIFIAGNVVVSWDRGELGRLFRWIPLRRRATSSKS